MAWCRATKTSRIMTTYGVIQSMTDLRQNGSTEAGLARLLQGFLAWSPEARLGTFGAASWARHQKRALHRKTKSLSSEEVLSLKPAKVRLREPVGPKIHSQRAKFS
jgi:hypothetical protein